MKLDASLINAQILAGNFFSRSYKCKNIKLIFLISFRKSHYHSIDKPPSRMIMNNFSRYYFQGGRT